MGSKIVKIRNWQKFKELINTQGLESIVYNIEQNGLSESRELTVLRIIAPLKDGYYIFIDFPKEDKLGETGIRLSKDNFGNRYIDEKDVIDFLKHQFNKKLNICSYWTI
ncbi:MAG: hypothetical protein OH319_03240 [Candidatus Parvarchaeota archaeon]|nr:hypothetical protein [Candidatus Jingweiarchaeum tengchongense]MCW1298510.1 hypothetical protein [Candidatus Jingweiarchaeum tengchongense]MCW1300244.1 hypothetical protein [Candidatus Jingweiarchaeum tengchongense]MCW1304522.1 hypothetical protein [Candidatus Jingweiarchaeum tengchongense]MCW1305750.1 hypothetical protein [Candidatus Jingweiarchaeum tengchongense]